MTQTMNPSHHLLTQSSSNLIVCFFIFLGSKPHLTFFLFSFTVHKDDISREQLKELLYDEIMTFQPAPITS